MTAGFVFTLDAIRSDVTGLPPLAARSVKTCTATTNRLLIDNAAPAFNSKPTVRPAAIFVTV